METVSHRNEIVRQPVALLTKLPSGYAQFLDRLKKRIRTIQTQTVLAVNQELVLLYWEIGRDILERQHQGGWGAKVIDRLSQDLARAFPQMKGFSPRNLKYMRAFAEAWADKAIVQQLAAQIPWFHNCTLLDKVRDSQERQWYIQQTIKNGWSRNVLIHQIESKLFRRQGKALSNFDKVLMPLQSDLVRETLKDPYIFDFLNLGPYVQERDLEQALLANLRDFILELGVGFAFVGNQYHLEIGKQDFYIDLLFYHLKLRCYVVIDLKIGEFKPEYAGKMNFYLSAADDRLRHSKDHPSIGIILCKSHNKVIVEYALRDAHKPIGVSRYKLTKFLPEKLKGQLPTIKELETELKESVHKVGTKSKGTK